MLGSWAQPNLALPGYATTRKYQQPYYPTIEFSVFQNNRNNFIHIFVSKKKLLDSFYVSSKSDDKCN
jgi:hypothetical protein